MKIFLAALVGLFFILALLAGPITAQSRKTIILVRHAEKDSMQAAMSGDPDLSTTGRERAERLAKIAAKFRPGAVFTSDTKRTRQTAEPIARRHRVELQIYDPRKQDELAKRILASKTKRFLIVGHSNTIPALASLLFRKNIFKDLDENEFGAIYIIRIRGGEIKSVEVRPY